MGERRWGNYSSCCRLCLSEKMDSLKPIFEDTTRSEEVVKNIHTFVDIEVTATDKLSTMICSQCLSQLDTWQNYKKLCFENQTKLTQWMNAWTSSNVIDISIQIKDEVVDDEGNSSPPEMLTNNTQMRVKTEVLDNTYEPEAMEEDIYDLPPPLTPHPPDEELPSNVIDDESESSDNGNDPIITPQFNGFEIISPQSNNSGRNCTICDKVFSSVGNRRKHEAMIHHSKDKTPKTPKDNNLNNSKENIQNNQNTPKTNKRPRSQSETDKIEFAAGLQLQQRSANANKQVPVENMPLTKVEVSYLEKYKKLFKMTQDLICTCHNEVFPNFASLFSHFRKRRLWFAIHTCYNCLITFADKSSYTKHNAKCQKTLLRNLKRMAESPVNPEIKMRLYQNFKCTKCNCVFTFHEDFCSHFDQDHMELVQTTLPYICHCKKSFNDMEDYKQHLHITCFLRYFCDVCFESFNGSDSFKEHCEKVHDNSEGSSLDDYDYYYKSNYILKSAGAAVTHRKSLPIAIKTTKTKKNDGARRKTVNLPPIPSNITAAPLLQAEDENYVPQPHKVINPHAVHNIQLLKKSTTCPLCGKSYASHHNMLRHYKLLHEQAGKVLNCQYCSERFRLVAELKDHQVKAHPEEFVRDFERSSANSQYKFSCPDCGDLFKNLDEWTKHTQNHPKKTCLECGKQFTLQSELDQHRSVHLNLKVYRDSKTHDYKSTKVSTVLMCEICDKSFASRSELRQHKLLHEKMPVLSVHDEETTAEDKKDLNRKYCCTLCNKHYVSYGGIWDHNKKYHSGTMRKDSVVTVTHKCGYCDKVLSTRAAWANHLKMHERNGETSGGGGAGKNPDKSKMNSDDSESYYTCNKCFKVFSSKYNLRNHMKCHGINLNPRSSTKTGKIIKTYWCDVCHQACPGFAELQDHKRAEHRNDSAPVLVPQNVPADKKKPIMFPCDLCSLKFPSNFTLKRHKEKHTHQQTENLDKAPLVVVYCKYCKIPFEGVTKLNQHMMEEHEEAPPKAQNPKVPVKQEKMSARKFPCSLCKKVFDHSGALASHQGWHKRGKVGKKIRTQGKLLRTMVNRMPDESAVMYQCYSCPQSFSSDTFLQIHILEQHRNVNATILNCETCKLSFNTKLAYDNHMHMHKNSDNKKSAKSHPCKYCAAAFSRSDTLNGHVRQHHKEHYQDTFKCNLCDRSFDKQNALTIHLKVHDKHRSVTNGGGSATGSNSPKPIHNKNIYFCSICNLGFAIAKDLRNHVVFAHPF